MSSSIGPLTFLEMTGEQIPPIGAMIDLFDRNGVDGTGWRQNPAKSRPIEKRTVEGYTSRGDANSAAAAYNSLKGALVTVVDQTGSTRVNVLVLEVQDVAVFPVLLATITGCNYLVRARWALMPTA